MSRLDLLPAAGPVLNLRQALYRACRDHVGGINTVALTMGVSPDALAKALSPSDLRPIRPEWVEEITAITQDPRLLASMVRPAGALAFVPQPVPATGEALASLGRLLQAEAEFVGSLNRGVADGRWEHHEVEELRFHANRVIGKILGIVAGAEQSLDAGSEVANG
jgi:hypothetical protein